MDHQYGILFRGETILHNLPTRRRLMIYAHAQREGDISQLAYEIKICRDNVKWYRRLKIVQLSTTGDSVPQLAGQFDLCQETVRNYVTAYNSGGIDALRPNKSPGRPPKIGQLTRDNWDEILRQTPNHYEKLETQSRQWTLDLLVDYVKHYIGEEVCFQTISEALRRCKYRTFRSKLRIGSPDPDYQVKL